MCWNWQITFFKMVKAFLGEDCVTSPNFEPSLFPWGGVYAGSLDTQKFYSKSLQIFNEMAMISNLETRMFLRPSIFRLWTSRGIQTTINSRQNYTQATGRQRLVILGTGWGSYSVLKHINKKLFDVIVISPRNHFLFTPLLCSTTVGTLEFRSIIEPIRNTGFRDEHHFQLAEASMIRTPGRYSYNV